MSHVLTTVEILTFIVISFVIIIVFGIVKTCLLHNFFIENINSLNQLKTNSLIQLKQNFLK